MKYLKTCLIMAATMFVLAACGGSNGGSQNAPEATQVPANGFGSIANHVHSMLVLPPNILILATHYGIYRSQNTGTTWQLVAGGPNQLMSGLMEYTMTSSSLNPQRLFVLAEPAVSPHKGIPGLYTSADQGRTWKLSVAASTISSSYPFASAAGNDTPDEVYIYLGELRNQGLKRSLDDGQHFSSLGKLPFELISGIFVVPNMPGHLFVYGSEGIASSVDSGFHWHVSTGINGGIQNMVSTGPHKPIYASGDAGIYVSSDGGNTFKLVYTQASYYSLTVSPQNAQVLYGKTSMNIYRSIDGGHVWAALPRLNGKGTLAVLTVVPDDPNEVYLSLSYPTGMYRLNHDGTGWTSLTPPT